MAVDGVSGDRNYTGWVNGGTSSTNAANTYNAVINTDEKSGISMDDFFQLMITQMTNQDFLNPSGDTEYMSQMAQMYSMQAMQALAEANEQTSAIALVGKTVTASKYNIGGSVNEQTGVVEKMMMEDGEYHFYVNGTPFTMSQIHSIQATEQSENSGSEGKDDDAAL